MHAQSFQGRAALRTRLWAYDGLHWSDAEVHEPRGTAELADMLARARQKGRKVTFRSGGCSLDGQSLNDDMVISLRRLDGVWPDKAGRRVTVGAGATWGSILRAIEPLGLVPFVTVTTSHATAGGTLSGDCLSRFSAGYGKEGRHVESFELLTLDGQLHTCTRRQNPELFHAVIGGLGYLGVVTRITYRLLETGFTPIRVETIVSPCESFEELAAELVPEVHDCQVAQRQRAAGGDASNYGDHHGHGAVSALAFLGDNRERGLVFRSRYVSDRPLRPTLNSMPDHWLRVPVEFLMRSPPACRAIWRGVYELYKRDRGPYVDDLQGYTFFMDGNVAAKRWGERFGKRMCAVQQTFIIPRSPGREHVAKSARTLVSFLSEVSRTLRAIDLWPTLFDILYVPADAFLLSASNRKSGFAVTLGFETDRPEQIQFTRDALGQLGKACLAAGGRVHLVKNVHASPADIRAMYAERAEQFFELKRKWDPEGTLRNAFVERLFPGLVAP